MSKTLVLGASVNSRRYSNIAINRLIANTEDVVAVGKVSGQTAGIKIETGKPSFKDIDTVTLYLNPLRQKEYYDYILSLKPKRVIFNPGTENMELVRLLEENTISYEIACTLVLLATGQY